MKSISLSLVLAASALTFAPCVVKAQEPVVVKTQPLIDAINKGDLAAVKEIVEKDPATLKTPSRYGSSPLVYAVSRNHKEIASFLLEKGVDPNQALSNAVSNRNKDMVALLLEKGADPNQDNQDYGYGSSLLDRALQYSENLDVAALLVAKGADLEKRDREGKTILMRRASSGSSRSNVEWLVDKGAKVNARDDRGQSALDYAILSNSTETITTLVEKGADVKTRDENGRTPLHNAIARNNAAVVKVFLDKGVDVNAAAANGDTPLHLAALVPGPLLNSLLTAGANASARNKKGDLPLHVALRASGEPYNFGAPVAASGARRVLRYDVVPTTSAAARPEGTLLNLLDKSDVAAKDGLGFTPLLLAISMRDIEARDVIIERKPKLDSTTQLFDAVAQGDVVTLEKILLAKPFLVYFRLPNGATPLHIAALWGTRSAAELLLKKGADVNARDAAGVSPLMMTASRSTGVYTKRGRLMAALLLDKGAEADARDRGDFTTLHRAVTLRDEEMVTALLAKGADADARDSSNQTPLHLLAGGGQSADEVIEASLAKKLLDAKANPNVRNASGSTPLALAVNARRVDFAKLLLERGANADARDSSGYSALARLVTNSYSYSSDSSGSKASKDLAALLLDKGADPNARTEYNGDNLLGRAATNGNKDLVALLLAKKADVNTKNSSGYTPIMAAVANGNQGAKDVVEMLLAAGADLKATSQSGETVLKIAKRNGNKDIIAMLEAKGTTE